MTLKPFEERYASMAKAPEENARAVLMTVHAESRDIQDGAGHPDRPAGDPRNRHDGRLRVLDPGQAAGDPARLDEVTQQFLAKARAAAGADRR